MDRVTCDCCTMCELAEAVVRFLDSGKDDEEVQRMARLFSDASRRRAKTGERLEARTVVEFLEIAADEGGRQNSGDPPPK